MASARLNITISADTNQAMRMFLASQGGGHKGDLSRFVEEAVRAHILELTADEIKSANKKIKEKKLKQIVEETLDWARNS
jgi:hypothetical protein